MDREKQIDKMQVDLMQSIVRSSENGEIRLGDTAHNLFNAGYRKQSDNTVEVVRCKDCKFCKTIDIKNEFPTRFLFCHRREHYSESVNDSDFCSYGERREES